MEIIDKNGRLFSKINIIDFLIVTFIALLLTSYFIHQRVRNKAKIKESAINNQNIIQCLDVPIVFNIEFSGLSPELVRLILVGDKFIEGDKIIGEILSILKIGADFYGVDLGDNRIINQQVPGSSKIVAKIRFTGRIENNAFYFRGQRLILGSTINFITDKYNIIGTIKTLNIPGEDIIDNIIRK